MTKTLIRIDPKTFRRNPHAGQSDYSVPGPRSVTVDAGGNVFRLAGGIKFNEEYIWGTFHQLRSADGPIRHGPHKKRFKISAVSITFENDFQHFRTIEAGPEFLYQYIPTKVECRNCGKSFLHTELTSDSVPDGDGGETFIDNVCPKCGEADCCDIEFEEPEVVRRRLKIK